MKMSMMMRRFIFSTLSSSSISRRSMVALTASALSSQHHSIGRRSASLSHIPMQQHYSCFFSTQAGAINFNTSWIESQKSDDEESVLRREDEERRGFRISVISKENIIPDSPTPENLRYYKLSMLDQILPPIYVPFTFFYPNNHEKNSATTTIEDIILERSKILKQSLSETLTRFYPFAGKVIDELHVSCNDEGAYYIETRVDDRLSNFLKKPDHKLLQQLLPSGVPNSLPMQPTLGSYVVMVQVNFFNCGGVAISMYTSHKLFDGSTYMTFLKAWAATARGSSEKISPSFVAPSLFLQNPKLPKFPTFPIWSLAICPALFRTGKCVTRRFVFDASGLAALKDKIEAAATSTQQHPSRVVAVKSLIWKCATSASRSASSSSKASFLQIMVNLRPRASPPLPQTSIGNIIWAEAVYAKPNEELELPTVVGNLKTAISIVNSNFVEELKGEKGTVKFGELFKNLGRMYSDCDADYYTATSMCKSGIYETDFGWGKLAWSSMGNLNDDVPIYSNTILLMDTSSGDGIEAWVTLSEQEMAIIERDPELLSFASVDPSPLNAENIPA